MEEFSRRALVALMVAAVGPGAALLTLLGIGPSLVVAAAPETDGGLVETVGGLLVGLVIGGAIAAVIAFAVAAAATLVALRATGCPRPYLACIVCLTLSPPWLVALWSLDLDLTGFAVLAGVLPGVVRLGFGYLGPTRSASPR